MPVSRQGSAGGGVARPATTVTTWVSTVAGAPDQSDDGCEAELLIATPEQHRGDALWLRGAETHGSADRDPPVAEKDQGEDEVSAYTLAESGAGGAV